MKHIKLFEELDIPKDGDYVLIHEKFEFHDNEFFALLENFINNNIGKIIGIFTYRVIVEYFDIPEKIKYFFSIHNSREVNLHKIISFGTKEQMELELQAKKYNL